MVEVASWLLQAASRLYTAMSGWGYIGLAIISFPIIRKLLNLARRIFQF